MKLHFRRDQRSGLGGIVFVLNVRAEISPDERVALSKYKLNNVLLYQRNPKAMQDTWTGIAKHLIHQALDLTIQVKDLAEGKKVECKNILEMLAVEEQLKEAGQNLAGILRAAMLFGGEQVVEV